MHAIEYQHASAHINVKMQSMNKILPSFFRQWAGGLCAAALTLMSWGAFAQSLEAAQNALSQKDSALSKRLIDEALDQHPLHLEWLLLKGIWLAESGQADQAEALLAPLAEAFPEWAPLHNNLALAQAQQHKWDVAIETLQKALMARPKDPLLLQNLARLQELKKQALFPSTP